MHFKFCLFRFFDLKIFADYQQSIELIDPAFKGGGVVRLAFCAEVNEI
jgi:hypothetical protein